MSQMFVFILLSIFKSVILTAVNSDIYLNKRNLNLPLTNEITSLIYSRNYKNVNETSSQKLATPISYENLKNTNKFPLENVFKLAVYRLNINSSSPCNYTGKALLSKCHKVIIFDSNQYETTIEETREVILNRIGLKSEPNFHIVLNTMKFLNGVNKKFIEQSETKEETDSQTEFDKKNALYTGSKTVKIIHEITGLCILKDDLIVSMLLISFILSDIVECEKLKNFTTPISNAICLNFVLDKLFFDENFSSVYLWLNFNVKDIWTNSKRKSNRLIPTAINITNMKQTPLIEHTNVKNGWNTIDITELIKNMKNQNETGYVLVVKCNKDCLIEIDNNIAYRTNVLPTLYLNKQQYPLLQLNIEDKKSSSKHVSIKRENHHRLNKRSRRDDRTFKIGDDNSENEAINYHIESESPNLCKNNIGHPNQECCLVSHYVSFSALKWSNWVIAPTGYRANFCIGRCSTARGKN